MGLSGPKDDRKSLGNTAYAGCAFQKVGLSVCMDRKPAGALEFYGTGPVEMNAGQDFVESGQCEQEHGYNQKPAWTFDDADVEHAVVRHCGGAEFHAAALKAAVHGSSEESPAETEGLSAVQNDCHRGRPAQKKLF